METDMIQRINQLRAEIDRIDNEIIKLLDKRMEIVSRIAKIKVESDTPIIDKARENEILSRAGIYEDIFREIIDVSVETQWRIKTEEIVEKLGVKDIPIGIVGYGRMGRLFAHLFNKYYRVKVYDIKKITIEEAYGIDVADSLEDLVTHSKYIMLATSLETIADAAAQIRVIIESKNLAGKIVFDIATLKYRVVKELAKYPKNTYVSTIHPMFGPNIRQPWKYTILIMGIENAKDGGEHIERIFKPFGFNLVRANVEVHDRYITYTIALPYLLGLIFKHTLEKAELTHVDIYGGPSYNMFKKYVEDVVDKDPPSFINEILSNPHIGQLLQNINSSIKHIISIYKRNRDG